MKLSKTLEEVIPGVLLQKYFTEPEISSSAYVFIPVVELGVGVWVRIASCREGMFSDVTCFIGWGEHEGKRGSSCHGGGVRENGGSNGMGQRVVGVVGGRGEWPT